MAGTLTLAASLLLRPAAADTPPAASHAFFIVATNGNDKWSGNRPAINSTATDGPFATLTNALAAARSWKRSSSNGIAAIFLRGGTHYLTAPLVLKPEDSGLVMAAYGTEKPVLSGGRLITGWKPVDLNGQNAWRADLPAARNSEWQFHELWVNGQRAVRARYPAHGYLKIAEVPDKTPSWLQGNARFVFQPSTLQLRETISDAEAVIMDRWSESRLPIASLEEDKRMLSFKKRSVFHLNPGDLYYLEGSLEFLREPGQWALDPHSGALYYLPRPGETIDKLQAIAPVLSQLIRLEGHPESGAWVDHVRFKGLTFSHTEWCYPEGFDRDVRGIQGIFPKPSSEVWGFGQAAAGVPGAIWGEGARNCSWKNCLFTHIGNYGLELTRGCDHNLISKCEFSELGAGGPKIGERVVTKLATELTGDNEISDCHVYDGGKFFPSAAGIWLGQTANNRIVHNLVHDFFYTGISIGWLWGYWPSPTTNNLVAYNHIHHIGAKSYGESAILSDLGGVYTLGIQPGTKILNNVIHDVSALTSPGIGIYLDEGSSGILIESNLVYRTSDSCFGLHYGGTNAVLNNIFAFGRDRQIHRHNAEPHVSLVFMRNLVYFDSGILLDGQWSPHQYRIDSNLYFDARPGAKPNDLRFGQSTLQQWQALGNDQHSIIADPQFRAPLFGDFRLAPTSPAFQIVFQPIDVTQVGIRK